MRTRVFLLIIATMCAGTSPGTALVGGALSLDGEASYVEIDPSPGLYTNQELTVTGWFRADVSLSSRSWQAIFWKGDVPDQSPYANREYGLWLSASGHLQLCSTPADTLVRAAAMLDAPQAQIQPGQWYHFAAVISTTQDSMQLYLNGRALASRAFHNSGIRPTAGPLRLGGIPDRDYFRGLLDEVRVWHRRLSPGEITRDLHSAVELAAPGLVAAYTFDDTDAPGSAADASGNGHTGQLRGQARLVRLRVLVPPLSAMPDSLSTDDMAPDYATSLAQRPIGGELADVLILALRSDDHRVRRRAAEALNQVGLADFPRVLREALGSDDYMVRSRATDALTRLGESPAVAGEVLSLAVHSPRIAWLEALRQYQPSPPIRSRRSWDSKAYYGWEDHWQANRPHDWELEPDGLVLRYNRVEGAYVGWRQLRTYRPASGLTHFGSVGYGLSGKQLRYQAGSELYGFYGPSRSHDNLAAVGGELHSFTDTQDGWLLSEEENSVHAVLFRRDFRDYYERQGWSVYTTHNIGGILQFTGRYQWDEFSSLDPEVEWGLFGDNLGRSSFRPNPALEAQQIHSLRTDLQLDTRDRRSNPRRGWFANALFERAGGFLGGDARFKRYLGDVRRYQPLSSGARMDLRLRLGTAKGALPQQYLYTLGGFGSLRGFDFKEFRGDRMVLINAEYWIDAERQWHSDLPIDGLHLGAFVDAGSTWYADDADNPFDQVDQLVSDSSRDDELKWQTNVGLAAGLGDGISIYASRPLKHQESWMLMLRFSRSL